MRLRSLTHLLEAIRALGRPGSITILGSSSLLPVRPELGEPGQPLETSYDADLLIAPIDDDLAAMLTEAVGQESFFAKRNGCYADILRPAIVETLPAGWQSRLHPVAGYDNVFALDCYDLALVKLVVGRSKDLDLVRGLLRLGVIEAGRLRQHYQATAMGEHEAATAGRNLQSLLKEIGLQ